VFPGIIESMLAPYYIGRVISIGGPCPRKGQAAMFGKPKQSRKLRSRTANWREFKRAWLGTPNLFKNFKSADILFAGTAGLRSRRQRSSKIRITFAYTLFPLLRSLRASVRPNVAISDQPTLGDPITEVLLTKRHRGGKDGGEVLYANTG